MPNRPTGSSGCHNKGSKMNNFKTIAFCLISVFNSVYSHASEQDPFILVVEELKIEGRQRNLNLEEFCDNWHRTMQDLKKESLKTGRAEKILTARANALVNLLRTNFNERGLDFLLCFAPTASLLDLADEYFLDRSPLNEHNRPNQPIKLLLASQKIYHHLLVKTIELRTVCINEFNQVKDQGATFSMLKFSNLPCSLGRQRLESFKNILEHTQETDKPLKKLHPETLDTLIEDLTLGLDHFSLDQKKSLAWCLYYLMHDKKTCTELYDYCSKKNLLERSSNLPPMLEWLKSANPRIDNNFFKP